MKYAKLYGSTYTLEEVEPRFALWRGVLPAKCWGCAAPCTFISYAWKGRPVPVCSPECYARVDEVAKLPPPPR